MKRIILGRIEMRERAPDNNGRSKEIGAPPISRVDLAERKPASTRQGCNPKKLEQEKGGLRVARQEWSREFQVNGKCKCHRP